MSYLKLADYLTGVSQSKDPEAVTAAMSAILEDIVSHRSLIMGVVHSVFHVYQLGDKDALEPLLKGLGVSERYPKSLSISEKALEGDNAALLYHVQTTLATVPKEMDVARIMCRALVRTDSAEAQLRILRTLDSKLKQEEALIAHMEAEVLV